MSQSSARQGFGEELSREPAGISPAPQPPSVPGWVLDRFAGMPVRHRLVAMSAIDRTCALTSTEIDGLALICAQLPHANTSNSAEFLRMVEAIYQLVHRGLDDSAAPHAVRMWNFIPGIHNRMDCGLERYQVFNKGRFNAFLDRFGDPLVFPLALPTATGVGHRGHDLAVHVLGTSRPGRPLENPRQRPAFQYSQRHGPRPPCFSRATIAPLPDGPRLLIGGTASVRGEESMHHDSLVDQFTELSENLQSLVGLIHRDDHSPLDRIDELRMYHRRVEDREQLEAAILTRFTGVRRMEIIQADICRQELLVEIEAVAEIDVNPFLQSSAPGVVAHALS